MNSTAQNILGLQTDVVIYVSNDSILKLAAAVIVVAVIIFIIHAQFFA